MARSVLKPWKEPTLKLFGEIGFGEAVIGRLELGDLRALGALERIEVGPAVAEEAVGVDQLQHGDLLLVLAGGDDGAHRAALGHLLEGGNDRTMRHVARGSADPEPAACRNIRATRRTPRPDRRGSFRTALR